MKTILFKKFFFENQLLLFVLDANGNFVAFNHAFESFLGSDVSIKGDPLWGIAAEDRSCVQLEAIFHKAKGGTSSTARVLMKRSSVRMYWVEIQLSQALVVDNELYIVGSLLDVTREEIIDAKVYEHEQNLTELTAQLRELNAAKSSFLGMAAHDLRTPLHKISFIADMLLTINVTPEKQRELLEILLRSSDEMKDLIDDLLSITQVESGRIDLRKTPVKAVEYLSALEREYSLLAETKNSRLDVVYPPEGTIIEIDQARVKQVLVNLLSNALKFSPPGSTIQLRLTVDGTTLLFEVIDQGPGVPDTEIPLLFKPFQKLTPRPTSGEPSSGLGLAISKQLVGLHGGEIGMKKVPTGGSNFWVSLPMQ